MYITNADIAAYLGVTLTAPQQAQVDVLIAQLQGYIEVYCNRKWGISGTITEKFDGGVATFAVKNPPIATIVEVQVDGAVYPAASVYNYTSFIRLANTPTNIPQNVQIKYTQDTTIPAAIKMALTQWVAQQYQDAGTGGKSPEKVTVGPVTVEYGAQDKAQGGGGVGNGADNGAGVPDFIQNILDKYILEPIQT